MARGKLFQYVILYHPKPTKEQNERNESPKSTVIVGPKNEVAVEEKHAAMIAAREIPAEYVDRMEDVEVVIRPF
jgi:hypothetical protein